MLKVKIIVGSTRPGRFSEALLPWLTSAVGAREGMEAEVIDLRDHPLPFFNAPMSPAYVEGGDYGDTVVNAFAAKIAEGDAFIVITPEYNHGPSAAIKNAMDVIYREWNQKPVAFVSYGSAGGARAVEQLRQVAVELQMASTRNAVHIMAPWLLRNEDGSLKDGVLESYEGSLAGTLDQLTWWGEALKAARSK